MTEHVRIEKNGGALAITLARPERRNALTVAMYAALADALEAAAGDPQVRVITFRGDGPDYMAGNDLADFLAVQPADRGDIPVWRFLRALAACEVPLVAAVHGNCVGIGTTMLLHCDLVIAAEGTRFSMPFVDLGLVPEAASSLLLPRLSGPRFAAKALLLGESFGVDEAERIGLISHRAPPEGLDEALARVTTALLRKPAEALRETCRLLRQGSQDAIVDRMRLESEAFAQRLCSEEVKQAIAAFFEQRNRAASA